MTKSQDFELKRRVAPKRGGKESETRGEYGARRKRTQCTQAPHYPHIQIYGMHRRYGPQLQLTRHSEPVDERQAVYN
jgi:hypothetical protein